MKNKTTDLIQGADNGQERTIKICANYQEALALGQELNRKFPSLNGKLYVKDHLGNKDLVEE